MFDSKLLLFFMTIRDTAFWLLEVELYKFLQCFAFVAFIEYGFYSEITRAASI